MVKDELMIVKEDNILLFFEEYLRGEGIHTYHVHVTMVTILL